MLQHVPGSGRVTVSGDKGYDTAEFVSECRHLGMTPHVAQNRGRRGGSAIDSRTTRHPSYAVSQKKRKRIEECFGWLKTIALLRKVRHRGTLKVDWIFSRLRRLQSGAHAKLDGCYRSGAVSPGRSVSAGCENAHREHPAARKIAEKLTTYSKITRQGEKSARATQFFSSLLEPTRVSFRRTGDF
jgi:hypothetical protein